MKVCISLDRKAKLFKGTCLQHTMVRRSRSLPTRLGKSEFVPTEIQPSQAEAVRSNSNRLVRVIDERVYVGPKRKPRKYNHPQHELSEEFNKTVDNTLSGGALQSVVELRTEGAKNAELRSKTGELRHQEQMMRTKNEKMQLLFRWNLYAFILHASVALFMLWFSNPDFKISVSTQFAAGPPGCVNDGLCERFIIDNFDATIAYWVVAFSALSALFHFIAAFPLRSYYEKNIDSGINPLRWIEYAFSSTVMILILMLLSGLTSFAALIGVIFANVSMILFGWLMEKMNPPDRKKTDWMPFIFGCIAGIGPWVAVYGTLIFNIEQLGVSYSEIPTFVWAILIIQFVFFNIFALNQAWQYAQIGGNRYYNGERGYIILSWTAKTVLAVMIYTNTLIL